ncbi:MAG: (deoxy)nucleoside triphosphate pyrophosphohydrolase [Lentisphaeria bacterium]|nr:(deoxy)nucleoside triphosphate pyrophosphohydrolase [Lentisphaeria bacterium]
MKQVTAAIVIRNSTVLLTRRAPGEKQAGLWEFPGGKIHPGETPEQCLRRELFEELGVEARIGRHVATNVYHYDHGSIELMAYLAEWTGTEFSLTVHDRAEWVSALALLDYDLSPADIPIAREVKVLLGMLND